MANQRDIAKSLSLSPATVSKVFRNAHDVGAATRARVLREAARIGYRSPVAYEFMDEDDEQFLKVTEPRLLALLYCQEKLTGVLDDPVRVQYLDGLSEAANLANASMVAHRVTNGGRDLLTPEGQPTAMRDGMVSGIVLAYQFDEDVVRRLAEMFPVATLTHWVPGAECDHIDSDHIGGMQDLVAHLKQLGHRRLGYYAPHGNTSYECSRYASFVRALAHEGLEFIPEAAILNGRERCNGIDEEAGLLQERMALGVTAFACSSDGSAFELLAPLERRGIRVPEDLSLTGFDKLRTAGTERRVTTVQTPFYEMGIAAVERLLRRSKKPDLLPAQILLKCTFVEGDTTGPVPV